MVRHKYIPEDHPSGIKAGVNKMVLGKMKDEFAGKQVQVFCGLSAKTYSFDNSYRKAKGVNKSAKKKYLTPKDYVRILNEEINREIECIKIGLEKFRPTQQGRSQKLV